MGPSHPAHLFWIMRAIFTELQQSVERIPTEQYTTLPTQSGPWNEITLYSFQGYADGGNPHGTLILDHSGNLYGTTLRGGQSNFGTVFELSADGGTWSIETLHTFNGADGSHPFAGVAFGTDANLYGTTWEGGVFGVGTVFELTSSGGTWSEKVLHSFRGGNDGKEPIAGVTFDSLGNLYSTASEGGDWTDCENGCGIVFLLHPHKDGSWKLNPIYIFDGKDGQLLRLEWCFTAWETYMGRLLYGGTSGNSNPKPGVVYKLTPTRKKWNQRVLHDFTHGQDGAYSSYLILIHL